MSASVRWDGLDELRAALRSLPEDLANDASAIVLDAGARAEHEIDREYQRHQRSGSLRSGLALRKTAASRFGTGVLLINRAPHAWLFEHGSQARHTAIGANRGSMPPANVFIPVVIRERRRMYDQLKDLLFRHGATKVSGDA